MASRDSQLRVSQKSLSSAKTCMKAGNYGRAFAHLLLVLKLQPEIKSRVRTMFTVTCRNWFRELASSERMQDMINCFEQASELYPECESMFNDMGSLLFRLGRLDEAASCFRRAVEAKPDFLQAKCNLENICSHLIERWHFRMLNDRKRNQAFNHSIMCAISNGQTTILDIGTGTGLLSMFAVNDALALGCEVEIYACEMSKTMHDLAGKVISANSMSEKIHLMHNKSTNLKIPNDIPERLDLIITETVDAGLLGEHILESLDHAWEHIIKPSTNKTKQRLPCVIPGGATVYVMLVESDVIRNENRLLYPALRELDLSSLPIVCNTSLDTDEPYTTENMKYIPGGFKQLTEKIEVLHINFNSHRSVREHLSGIEETFTLPVITAGRVDGIVMWFDLHLDSCTKLSSAVDADSCWEQAVYPVLPQHLHDTKAWDHCCKENFFVKVSDCISVSCKCQSNVINLKVVAITRFHKYAQSAVPSPVMNGVLTTTSGQTDNHLTQQALVCSGGSLTDTNPVTSNHGTSMDKDHNSELGAHCLKRCELARLNDIYLNSAYCMAVHRMCQNAAESGTVCRILDLTQGFSTVCLQSVKLGAKTVKVCSKSARHKDILQSIARNNGINMPDSIQFCSEQDVDYSDRHWDVLVTDLVEPCGALRENVLEEIAFNSYSQLKPTGLVLPCSAVVYGMCIQSSKLEEYSYLLDDDRTLGLSVKQFMNCFQMSNHVDLDLKTLPHDEITTIFKLFHFHFNENEASDCDRDPTYLHQDTTLTVSALEAGQISAVVYWFDLIFPETTLSTLDPKTHWKQAAVVLKRPVQVAVGDSVVINAVCQDSCLDVSVKPKLGNNQVDSTVH